MSLIQITRTQHSYPEIAGAIQRFWGGIQNDAQIAWRILREWHRRSVSRSELRVLGEAGRGDLGHRYDFEREAQKSFWEA